MFPKPTRIPKCRQTRSRSVGRPLAIAILLIAAFALPGCLGFGSDGEGGGDDVGPEDAFDDPPTGEGGSGAPGSGGAEPQPEDPPGGGQSDPSDQDPQGEGSRNWGEPADASIRPGVQITTAYGQCTSNFIFTTPAGHVLIGLAAHCFGTDGDATQTNGCTAESAPIGTEAQIQGASQPGLLLYSSWLSMQAINESSAAACAFNDFALVWLHPDDWSKAHPAMLHYGGPTAMATSSNTALGDRVLTYGNTGLRPGPSELDEREGFVVEKRGDGWTHSVTTATPGLPGDSGSGVLTGGGEALGILVTVAIAPIPASNGVTSLDHALAYAAAMGVPVTLATWEQLDAGLLP